MKDCAGQELSSAPCPGNGREISWDGEAWVRGHGEPAVCPWCGHVGLIAWVRGSDLPYRGKVKAHKVPKGVAPAPWSIPNGGKLYTK